MRPRFSTLVSIVVHAVVIGAIVIGSAVAPGALPSPRDILDFTSVKPIKAPDVPPPPMRSSPTATKGLAADAAPIQSPDRITEERPAENSTRANTASGDPGVISGVPGGLSDGTQVIVPPPPQRHESPTPTAPIRLHAGIEAPRKIFDVSPEYPAIARAARQEGVVILESVIDTDGRVESVRVLKGFPLLNQSAIDAVRQWRFTPAQLNGHAVPVVMTVTVMFRLQ